MGKNMRQESSSNIQLHNGNSGCMNKILHALNRRHRWQNVRKVLPNKRQGSGKQIIDGGSYEANTCQPPPDVDDDHKGNKPKMEQSANTEGSSTTSSKSSKKFRIRSLISGEMAKRRGKHHRRGRSPSPRRQTTSVIKELKNDDHLEEAKPSTKVTEETNCESPSTAIKKRKCDICAAMLTVSYLRKSRHTNETGANENLGEINRELKVSDDHDFHSHTPSHSKIGLTKSFSFPILGSSKRRDSEIQELKNKLKDCKDMQTAKEKFILPMRDIGIFPKPMLTRPASFKTPDTTSKKDKNKQTIINSKTLKQKIGFNIKDSKKEKRRILMDAVFHKIPYGRRSSSKDPKKMSLKSNSISSSSGSDGPLVEKSHLKKTASTSEAMTKYRRLLSQTSTRDQEKMKVSDHRTKLFVAAGGEHSFGFRHKRVCSLPNISPSDFTHNQEFPVKPTISISNALFDDQQSLDRFVHGERLNVYTPTKKVAGKKTRFFEKNEVVDENLGFAIHQEKLDRKEFSSATEETKLVDSNDGADQNLPDHEEIIDSPKQTILFDKDEAIDTETIDHQGEPRVTIEVEKDKSFNDILGMFKKVSDERTKINQETDSVIAARKVAKNTTGEGIEKKVEVGQKTLDDQEKNKSTDSEDNKDQGVDKNLEDGNKTLGSCDEVEIQTQEDSQVQTSFIKDIRNSPFKEENKHYGFSTPSTANKRLELTKLNMRNGYMMEDGFLYLDIATFRDNAEFQFVKKVLERSGFLEIQFLGEWYSNYQPIDPVLFEQVETTFLQSKKFQDLDSMKDEEATKKIDHHLLLFDIINEALLHLQNKTFTYCPHPLTYRSKVRPMPIGLRVLEEVWNIVTMYLSWKPELQPSLDDVLSRDLEKGYGWMNLQSDAEFVGIELEEMIADDLLDELVFDDLLM